MNYLLWLPALQCNFCSAIQLLKNPLQQYQPLRIRSHKRAETGLVVVRPSSEWWALSGAVSIHASRAPGSWGHCRTLTGNTVLEIEPTDEKNVLNAEKLTSSVSLKLSKIEPSLLVTIKCEHLGCISFAVVVSTAWLLERMAISGGISLHCRANNMRTVQNSYIKSK